jgi:hypothetical protein
VTGTAHREDKAFQMVVAFEILEFFSLYILLQYLLGAWTLAQIFGRRPISSDLENWR